MAVALAIHRRGRPLALRWAFEPLIGERRVRGGWGHLIDNIALIGTVFGVATSLGLGVTQMSAGLRALGIVPEDSPWLEYAMIGAVTCVVLYTVVSRKIAVPPRMPNQTMQTRVGTSSTPAMNSRTVRPREMRAMKMPTNGVQDIHQPQ